MSVPQPENDATARARRALRDCRRYIGQQDALYLHRGGHARALLNCGIVEPGQTLLLPSRWLSLPAEAWRRIRRWVQEEIAVEIRLGAVAAEYPVKTFARLARRGLALIAATPRINDEEANGGGAIKVLRDNVIVLVGIVVRTWCRHLLHLEQGAPANTERLAVIRAELAGGVGVFRRAAETLENGFAVADNKADAALLDFHAACETGVDAFLLADLRAGMLTDEEKDTAARGFRRAAHRSDSAFEPLLSHLVDEALMALRMPGFELSADDDFAGASAIGGAGLGAALMNQPGLADLAKRNAEMRAHKASLDAAKAVACIQPPPPPDEERPPFEIPLKYAGRRTRSRGVPSLARFDVVGSALRSAALGRPRVVDKPRVLARLELEAPPPPETPPQVAEGTGDELAHVVVLKDGSSSMDTALASGGGTLRDAAEIAAIAVLDLLDKFARHGHPTPPVVTGSFSNSTFMTSAAASGARQARVQACAHEGGGTTLRVEEALHAVPAQASLTLIVVTDGELANTEAAISALRRAAARLCRVHVIQVSPQAAPKLSAFGAKVGDLEFGRAECVEVRGPRDLVSPLKAVMKDVYGLDEVDLAADGRRSSERVVFG